MTISRPGSKPKAYVQPWQSRLRLKNPTDQIEPVVCQAARARTKRFSHSVRRPFVFADERERAHHGAHLVVQERSRFLSRDLKPKLSLVGVMRPEKITLHSKAKAFRLVQFRSRVTEQPWIDAIGLMVDTHEMDRLIVDHQDGLRQGTRPCGGRRRMRRLGYIYGLNRHRRSPLVRRCHFLPSTVCAHQLHEQGRK